MLGFTSWKDIKTREVSDSVWLVFGVLGLVLNIYEVITGEFGVESLAIPILFSAVLSFIFGYFGLFGGADFKAFVVLALLMPHRPGLIRPFLGILSQIYPLTIFSNSALAGATFALILLLRNVSSALSGKSLFEEYPNESYLRKFVILFSGSKVGIESIRGPPFQYPLEIPLEEDESKRKLILMPDIEDDESAEHVFQSLKESGLKEIWVSQTLPFLVFIFFGFLCTLLIGDVALWVLLKLIL
jgi:preflagellin peptidase FlaK